MHFPSDAIVKDAHGVLQKSCDVVAMTGYLETVDANGNYRLYKDAHFRSYILIGENTIMAHAVVKDNCGNDMSRVWLDADETIVLCEVAPVRAYQPPPRGDVQPGDEDIGALKYPR